MKSFISPTANCRVRWMEIPGQGIPLVFVHGIGCASSYDYPPIVSDQRFESRPAILIDLPGHGYSEKPKNFSYNIREQAKVVDEVISYLRLKKYFLYGHSMGGSIAIELASSQPQGLVGIVVSEPNLQPGGGLFSKKIFSFSEDVYVEKIHAEMVKNETGPWSGCISVAAPWAMWKGSASLVEGGGWMKTLCELGIPKAFLIGEQSLPDTDYDILNEAGVTASVLPECGHSMAYENPSQLAAALNHFCLSQLD